MEDTLVNFGSEIKTAEETDTGYKFGGWLVVFDSHDVSTQRDKFTKSTDFDIEDGDRISLFYNHGLDSTIKKTKIGGGRLSIKDAGIWLDGEVKKRADYLAQHIEKIGEGLSKRVAVKGEEHTLFGLSSGALSHLVDRVPVEGGHEIKMWKIGEASITPTPAEPLTTCISLKSLIDIEEAEEIKKYDPRQPRDDTGKWTTSSGGLSAGHAIHVMKHEGISGEHHHEAVKRAIESGEHKTREDVLRHIDAIHQENGTAPPKSAVGSTAKPKAASKPLHEMSHQEIQEHLEANPHLIEKDEGSPFSWYRGESGAMALVHTEDSKRQNAARVLEAEREVHNKQVAEAREAARMTGAIDATLSGSSPMTSEDTAALSSFRKLKSWEKNSVERVINGQAEADTPEQQRMADAAKKWHAGTPYEPPAAGKEPRFSKKDRDWLNVTEEGFVTDTHVLIKGEPPKGVGFQDLRAEGTPPKSEKLWPVSDGKEITPKLVKPEGYDAADAATTDTVRVYMNDGTAVNKKYLDLVKSRFPDATFHSNGHLKPIVIKSKGERVGILMPMVAGLRDFAQKSLDITLEQASFGLEIKSHNFTSPDEVVTAVTDILRSRMPAEWHSDAVRATVKSFAERVAGITDIRASEEYKAGRVLSQANYDRLCSHRDALREILGEIEGLLETHAPPAADTAAGKSLSDTEAQQLMARYVATMARLNGVPLDKAA